MIEAILAAAPRPAETTLYCDAPTLAALLRSGNAAAGCGASALAARFHNVKRVDSAAASCTAALPDSRALVLAVAGLLPAHQPAFERLLAGRERARVTFVTGVGEREHEIEYGLDAFFAEWRALVLGWCVGCRMRAAGCGLRGAGRNAC